MGSKTKIGKDILNCMLSNIDINQYESFIEPFVGGANFTSLFVQDSRCEHLNYQGFDYNYYVVALLNYMADGNKYTRIHTKEEYNQCRDYIRGRISHVPFEDYEIGFLGICCSYCGRWFEGFASVTKTRNGMRDYQEEARKNINNQVHTLKGLSFNYGDYKNLKVTNSIIYCDPPYKNTKEYFSKINHEEFYYWCREMVKHDNVIFVSSYDMPIDFKCIWEKQVKSTLSSNGEVDRKTKQSTEKLFILTKGNIQ